MSLTDASGAEDKNGMHEEKGSRISQWTSKLDAGKSTAKPEGGGNRSIYCIQRYSQMATGGVNTDVGVETRRVEEAKFPTGLSRIRWKKI